MREMVCPEMGRIRELLILRKGMLRDFRALFGGLMLS